METSHDQEPNVKTLPEGWWGADVFWKLQRERGTTWTLSQEAIDRVEACHVYLLGRVEGGDTLYGINTGFGDLATTRVDDLAGLQRNLLRSHACGVGDPLPQEVVSAMLLLKVKSLSQGHSGVAVATVQRLLDHWNACVLPVVPRQGSLGASGDLAPLAHLVLPLIGEGEVIMSDGRRLGAGEALAELGWKPLALGPKEGLALINGTQMMLGMGMVALERVTRLAEWADAVGAWSLEAWNGLKAAMHPSIHRIRNQAGAMISAHNVASWLEGSQRMDLPRAYVQDPYSFRCLPQVHGASRDVLEGVRAVLEAEVNAVTDNPLVFPDEDLIVSGGNFHGQPLALAMDRLALAVHEWGSISERRTFKLLSGKRGLPAFLASSPGLNSGYMIPQYTAASLVSYSKQLCTPASADNADSSNGQEDHVSMGANGALQMWLVMEHTEQVLGIEAMCAAQASDLRGTDPSMAPALRQLQDHFRRHVPFLECDDVMAPHMEAACAWIRAHDPKDLADLCDATS
ncbi:MAG: histidine ammonia-lyase [Bacteroidetes bacterium]|nr:histidine ammonia-lyase [Bacteroidota bacterium]MDA0903629.1 histidine ammonia-lyase [Bacteroidota bacterium]MDA1242617.1 histidine ammonia-lyase [Bacteroidota bacterium]